MGSGIQESDLPFMLFTSLDAKEHIGRAYLDMKQIKTVIQFHFLSKVVSCTSLSFFNGKPNWKSRSTNTDSTWKD